MGVVTATKVLNTSIDGASNWENKYPIWVYLIWFFDENCVDDRESH